MRYTKKNLLIVLEMSRTTFCIKMKILEPEIKHLFPFYRKTDKYLSAELFNWICAQIGPEKEEIQTIFLQNFAAHRPNVFGNQKSNVK